MGRSCRLSGSARPHQAGSREPLPPAPLTVLGSCLLAFPDAVLFEDIYEYVPFGLSGEGCPDMKRGASAEQGVMFTNSWSAGPDSPPAERGLRLRGASPPGLGGSAGDALMNGRVRADVGRSVRVGCGEHTGGGGIMPTGESDAALTETVQVGGREEEDSGMVRRWSRGRRPGLSRCSCSHNTLKLSNSMATAGPGVVIFLEVRLFSSLKTPFPE